MSDFTAIGRLVTKAQELLDSIKGGAIQTMQSTFSSKLVAWQNTLNAALAQHNLDVQAATAPTTDQLANIALTQNQPLSISSGNTVPDMLAVNSHATVELVATVHADPRQRSTSVKTLLSQIEAGVQADFPNFNIRQGNHYFKSFNVIRITWDFAGDDPTWLFFPQTAVGSIPISAVVTGAALVKLESGELGSKLLADGAVTGEWRFTKIRYGRSGGRFGEYAHPHPYAKSQRGSMLIALPVMSTGYIDHPNKLFALPELN